MKIAVSGKGGVGKTTVAGNLARILFQEGFKVLAIDADPNANLALTLDVPVGRAEKILPVSENIDLIQEKTGVQASSYGGVFRLSFRVDDIVDRFGLRTPVGVDLLVMGIVRSAGQGCMCPANALTRALIRHLLVGREEAVVLDMEAGTEHFGRRTAENVEAMLIVSDANRKSLETAKNIYNLSMGMGVKKAFIIGNRVLDSLERGAIQDYCRENLLPILHIIPYDEEIRKSDVKGEILDLSKASPGVRAVRRLSEKLLDSLGRP